MQRKGIILAGGPESVTEGESPRAPQIVFELGVPVLGICYGMQLMNYVNGGKVEKKGTREDGTLPTQAIPFCLHISSLQASSIFQLKTRARFSAVLTARLWFCSPTATVSPRWITHCSTLYHTQSLRSLYV